MKDSILEALADNRLAVDLNRVEQTEAYQALKQEIEPCVEEALKIVGKDMRPIFDQLCSIINEYYEAEAKDTFLYAFRFGALSTIEVWMNQELLTIPKEEAREQRQSVRQFQGLVLEYMGADRILSAHPERPTDQRSLEIDCEEDIFREKIGNSAGKEKFHLDEIMDHFDDIQSALLSMRKTNGYIHGYCLGVSLIEELFQDRKLILDGYE